MPSAPSRAQIAVFAGIGVVLLLLAVKALGSGAAGSAGSPDDGISISEQPAGGVGAPASAGGLIVHVAGAVADPGVYRLPAGARVTDALKEAGGPTDKADQNRINLAAMLADGQQVVVPSKVPASGVPAIAAGATEEGPISLGTATEADLETIDGIGPVTAADIIEYRDANGGVGSIEQLDEVPGIGPATIAALSERLQP
jgi:competence protein ComEA